MCACVYACEQILVRMSCVCMFVLSLYVYVCVRLCVRMYVCTCECECVYAHVRNNMCMHVSTHVGGMGAACIVRHIIQITQHVLSTTIRLYYRQWCLHKSRLLKWVMKFRHGSAFIGVMGW